MSDPNIQALLAIASNGVCFCGHANGVSTLIGALIVSANRYPGYTQKLLLFGAASETLGFVVPALVDNFGETHEIEALALGWVALIPLIACGIWSFLVPRRIVKKRYPQNGRAILGATLMPFVPLGWHIALWMATKPAGGGKFSQTPDEESYSRELLSVRDRAKRLLPLLEQAGLKMAADRVYEVLDKHTPGDELMIKLDTTLDRLMFDFEVPEDLANEIRAVTEESRRAQQKSNHL
jgi:hypothetical protein